MWNSTNSFAGGITTQAVRSNSTYEAEAQMPRLRKAKLIVISEIPDFSALNTYESSCPISGRKLRKQGIIETLVQLCWLLLGFHSSAEFCITAVIFQLQDVRQIVLRYKGKEQKTQVCISLLGRDLDVYKTCS